MGFGVAIQAMFVFPIRLLAIERLVQATSANALRMFVTVNEFTSKALQMAWYVQFGPSSLQSDLSKILARRSFRAGALPEDTNFSRYDRSSEVSVTKYFLYIWLLLEWVLCSRCNLRAYSEFQL